MKYYYRCSNCNKRFNPKEIENNFIYLCPQCGSANKNSPLTGVLLIEYDYSSVAKKYSKENFLNFEPGKFWQYPELWPLNKKLKKDVVNNIVLSNNPISKFNYNGKPIYLMDETRNPTYSFKDRASLLVCLKAMELNVKKIVAASTGNAGSSLAGISARLNLTSKIFVPANIPEAKRIQIEAFGAEIELVNGDYDLAFDICLDNSIKNKWYNRNTAYNPLTIEGKKWGAYDIFLSLKGAMPDNIFIPVGDGVIISGIFKGMWELKKLKFIKKIPRLIAVQASGSNALYRYLKTGTFKFKKASTIADSISAGAPRNLFLAAKAVRDSGGIAITLTDNQILNSQKELANKFGILGEPSSAAAFGAYKKASKHFDFIQNGKNLILITGSGLKDINSLEKWTNKN